MFSQLQNNRSASVYHSHMQCVEDYLSQYARIDQELLDIGNRMIHTVE